MFILTNPLKMTCGTPMSSPAAELSYSQAVKKISGKTVYLCMHGYFQPVSLNGRSGSLISWHLDKLFQSGGLIATKVWCGEAPNKRALCAGNRWLRQSRPIIRSFPHRKPLLSLHLGHRDKIFAKFSPLETVEMEWSKGGRYFMTHDLTRWTGINGYE